jgi:hypothetical protein
MKFFLLIFFLIISASILGQEKQIFIEAGQIQRIAVKKSDQFTITATIPQRQKRNVLITVAKAVGLSALTYELQKKAQPSVSKDGVRAQRDARLLAPAIGVGIAASIPDILNRINTRKKQQLEYALFDKEDHYVNGARISKGPVKDGMVELALHGQASSDGLLVVPGLNNTYAVVTIKQNKTAMAGAAATKLVKVTMDDEDCTDPGDDDQDIGDPSDNADLPDVVPDGPEADDFFDGYTDNGETGVITDYDGNGHDAYYVYDDGTGLWVLNHWDGESDPRGEDNPGGYVAPAEGSDMPATSEDQPDNTTDEGNGILGSDDPDGTDSGFYIYDPETGLYVLEYFDPGTPTGTTSVPGDHHLPDAKLPPDHTTNTQVGNFCVFKTMEWLAKFYGSDVNSGTYLLYYMNLKKNFAIINTGFQGTFNDLNALLDHFFNITAVSNTITSDAEVKAAIDAGHPIAAFLLNGILPDGSPDGHEIFIMGYNNDGTYEYFDPQSGTYESASPSTFKDMQIITGVKP